MKLVKTVSLLVIAIAVSLSTGCRKGLDKTTQIPGRGGLTGITDKPANARDGSGGLPDAPPLTGNPSLRGDGNDGGTKLPANVPDTGIPPTGTDFTDWQQDREMFKNQTVLFDFDKSIVKASEVPKLEEVAKRMKTEFVGKALRIEGHCDERGTEEYNRALGDRRALSVREKLVQLGVDAAILPTISYGEERPADPGHNETAWKANRRGELILLSPPAK